MNAASSDLVEGAKRERELVLYASLTTEEANVLLPKFEAKYPFLKVQFIRSGSERLLTRVLAEARAKKGFADVVQTVEFSMHTLKVKGIVGRYQPAEGSVYPKEFKEDDYWTSFYYHPYVVAYNKKLLPQTNVPKTYQDLLSPVLKGKLMTPNCCVRRLRSSRVKSFTTKDAKDTKVPHLCKPGMVYIMNRAHGLHFC